MKIKDSTLLNIVDGTWNGIPGGVFTNFAVDSRKVLPSGLFFALEGVRTDGHLYTYAAVKNGATGIVAEKRLDGNLSVFVLKTDSSKRALFSLGKYARSMLNGKVIGITGSSGKTTVKEMIAFTLKTKFSVSATKGNANTEYSIPLFFLNDAEPDKDFHIVEMGVQKKGDMETLISIASPDIAVLLNAGKSHLEFLKTVKEVANEKFVLARFVYKNKKGVCFINGDDREFSLIIEKSGIRPILFGLGPRNDVRARIRFIGVEKMILEVFSFDESAVQTFPFSGVHYVYDILATVAVSHSLGIDLKTVLSALSDFKPISGRGNIVRLPGERIIFDETYNANPLSLEYSLSRFKNRKKKLFVIVGDMLELGEKSKEAHLESGKVIASLIPENVITYGKFSRFIADVCENTGIKNVKHFTGRDSLLKYVREVKIPEQTFIFIKGSRGMKMEEILKILIERFAKNE